MGKPIPKNDLVIMASELLPNPKTQHVLLKISKALVGVPAQILYYGLALSAIAAIGGTDFPGVFGTLTTVVGMNVLVNVLERIAHGDEIPNDEIRQTVENAIRDSGIDRLATSNEFQRTIAHVFRQFDILKYAIQQGEIEVVEILRQQFAQYEILQEELKDELSFVQEKLDTIAKQNMAILTAVQDISIQTGFSNANYPINLVNQRIKDEVGKLRKSRFFPGFDRIQFSEEFTTKLLEGELSGGNPSLRSQALAWCARLVFTEVLDQAEIYLKLAKNIETNTETKIADAFIHSKNDKNAALVILAGVDNSMSRSAAFMIVVQQDGPQEALNWLKKANIQPSDLDSDGKFYLLLQMLQLSNWDAAFECINQLTPEDFLETPFLHRIMAMTHLVSAVPYEFRSMVLIQVPFEAARFPLSDDTVAIVNRRIAHEHFVNAVKVAHELNFPEAAAIDKEYALWLELKDPNESEKGKQRLKAELRNPRSALHLVRLALQFRIPLDLDAVEREIEAQTALNGGITLQAAVARFALAFTQRTPEDVGNYVDKHYDELVKYFDKLSLRFLQIEMFSQAGLPNRANEYLAELMESGLSPLDENRLRAIIAGVQGIDILETLKEQFKTTDSLNDLGSLVDELQIRNQWEDICNFGELLFKRTRALHDAERLANALNMIQKSQQLVDFIKANSDLLLLSKNLQIFYCWSLYQEGALLDARAELAKLSNDPDNLNYRALQINLAITMGDWNLISAIVAHELSEKDKRTAQELISAAQLALTLGSPYAKELFFAAAEKGHDDAGILAAAYFLASKADLEDNDKVFSWIERAAVLSGDNGPIRTMTIKDILDRKPEWDRRESETLQQLGSGNIPMFLAARSLNKSLIDLVLFPAYANQTQKDPRRKVAVAAYSGKRGQMRLETRRVVGIDATALLTLSFLNLLDKVFDIFETIYMPHSTLGWLFEEKGRASFHQPSRIKDAYRIRHLLATGAIGKLIPGTVADSDLSTQIGDELAQLIAEAENDIADGIQRIVVRSSPIHQVSSLLDEEADLTSHESVLSSCQTIVEKLRENGQITAEEEKKASAYLQFHEKPWPNQPDIADNAILYLDYVAVSYFLHLGILEKISAAGFNIIISSSIVSETDELISYEGISDQVNEDIEQIRSAVSLRIETGKIKVGRQHKIDDEPEKQSVFGHPTFGVVGLTGDCDALIVDDRFLNQHEKINGNSSQVPVFSTLDLLDALVSVGSIKPEGRLEYRTRLRRAGYFFIPVDDDELTIALGASAIRDDKIIETAELKAIRENFLRVRMSTWLQLPKESSWLDMSLQAFIHVLKGLWKAGADFSWARTQSNWIIDQINSRGWIHRLGENGDNYLQAGETGYILMLIIPPTDASSEVRDEYWSWVEDKILGKIKEEEAYLYSLIVDWQRQQITKMADLDLPEEKLNGK